MKLITRLVLYVRDIMNITGKKERSARRMFNTVRKHYGYHTRAFIAVKHFCEYYKLDEEDVMKKLLD